jgi:fatty-acyl-CoA synthase
VERANMRPWIDKTLWESLSGARATRPDGLAVLYASQKLTYEDLVRRVERFAAGLLKIGVRKGDKVSIWSGNCPEWLIAKFAIVSIGAVVVPINTRFKTSELEYVLANSDSTTVLLGETLLNTDFVAIMREILPEIEFQEAGKIESERFPLLRNVIALGRCEHQGVFSYACIEDSGDDAGLQTGLEALRARVTVDDVANIFYTSGTTGLPKGVMLSHRLLSNAFYVGEELRLTPDDRLLLYLPFNHCFGLHNGVCGGISHGSTIVLMDYFDAEVSLKLIERHRVTVLFGVPTMYLMQIHHPRFASYDISSLRTGMIGGAGAPASMIQEIMDAMGITLISTYGMTETSCAVTQTRYRDSAEVISQTVGQVLPHLEMKVIGKDQCPLGPDAEGEICIRGPSVTSGYYKNLEATRKLIDEEGWVHSGDLGTFNEEGYYRITGRLKDLIIRGGENIAPSEIESFLYQHPDIQQVQVVGVPDEKFGEAVAAFVIPRPGSSLTAEDLIGFCRGRIATFKIPSVVRFVSEFPVTASGKIKKFELRKMVTEKV